MISPRPIQLVPAIAALLGLAVSAAAQCDLIWKPANTYAGINGTALALAVRPQPTGDQLFVAGDFTAAGDVAARYIAMFDGTRWQPVGTEADGAVSALCLHNDQLFAAGRFRIGATRFWGLARWDGANWVRIERLSTGDVTALASYQGELIVGLNRDNVTIASGRFSGIARWNGSAWSSLGLGLSGAANALAVVTDQLFAGGVFTTAGGNAARNIASWNGSEWSPVGNGVHDPVRALTAFEGRLIVGGEFNQVNDGVDGFAGIPAAHVARWDGAMWAALGDGINLRVTALAARDGLLVAGSDQEGLSLFQWNGTTWNDMTASWAGDYRGQLDCLTIWNGAPTVGGSPNSWRAGAMGVMAYRNGAWGSVGPDAVVGDSSFATHAGAVWSATPSGLLRYDGRSWTRVSNRYLEHSDMLRSYRDDLIVFQNGSGGAPNGFVLRWDGIAWQTMQNGLSGPAEAAIVYSGELIVYGAFGRAGNAWCNGLARWDGVQWRTMGLGPDQRILAFTTYEGELIAGGSFQHIGSFPFSHIARWNGTRWAPLGDGTDEAVLALETFQGELYAAGEFNTAGGIAAPNLARWNGTTWTAVGQPNHSVWKLYAFGNELLVQGAFSTIGGVAANRAALWDGVRWAAIVDWPVIVTALNAFRGELIVGFTDDPTASPFVQRLSRACAAGDTNCDGSVNLLDIDPFVLALLDPPAHSYEFPNCPWYSADMDADGYVTGFDIDPFVACALGGACP